MERQKMNGFTIVELVIVIAVIAILSAALIPTFSGILSKTNESSAYQEAANALKQYVFDNPTVRSFEDDGQVYYAAYFSKKIGDTTYHYRYEPDGRLIGITDDDLPNSSAGWLKMPVYETQEELPASDANADEETSALYRKRLTTGEDIIYYQTQPNENGLSSITIIYDTTRTFWVLQDKYYAETAVCDIDFASVAQAPDDPTVTIDSQGVRYKSNDDGTAKVVGSDGTCKDIVIADVSPNGDKVTSVAESAFTYASISSVVLGKNIISLESHAFSHNNNLTSVTLNEGLKKIKSYAFYSCRGLTSITLPSSLTSLVTGSFKLCTALASITVPANCQIDAGALPITGTVQFEGGGTEYTVGGYTYRLIGDCLTSEKSGHPENKTLLWARAESSQSDIVIPADQSITTIGKYCFTNDNFATLTIPDSVTTLGASTLYNCTSLTHIYGGNGLKTIENSALGYCTKLQQFHIPASIKSIGDYALSGCSCLDITISSPLLLNNSVAGVHSFSLTSEMAALGYRVESGCLIKNGNGTGDTIIAASVNATIPNDGKITTIATGAFRFWKGTADLTIPDSVTTIGDNLFNGSSGVKNVTLGANITSVGSSFMSYCTSVETVSINCSITELGSNTLTSAKNLKTLTLPGTITKVGYGSFNNCTKLTDIYFGGTKDAWNSIDFPENWDSNLPSCTIHCTDGNLVVL